MRKNAFIKVLLASIFCLLALISGASQANEKKEGGEGSSSVIPLEPFTVNLSSFDRYLQISLTLQLGAPETGEKVKAKMPIVRHAMIMLLSGKESSDIQNGEGKHELINEIKEKLNSVLELKERDGVTDVYFVNFVIQ